MESTLTVVEVVYLQRLLTMLEANEEERRAASMSGTSSGSSYGDGVYPYVQGGITYK